MIALALRVNPAVLKLTLRKLATLRAAVLALALELCGLQAVALVQGAIWQGLALSAAGICLAFVYVFTQPELLIFSWEDDTTDDRPTRS